MLKDVRKRITDCEGYQVILLKGTLGSGKTYFVKNYMLEKYGFDEVSSPTFSLLNTYVVKDKKFAHFDCYRKYDLDIILDALLTCDTVFIEWFDDNIKRHVYDYIILDCENDQIYEA